MSKQIEAMKRWVEVFGGNWHDEPVDSEWADRAHQALAEMRQAIAEQLVQQEPLTDIYRSFEQWKNGNVLEHGVPRTEYYSEAQLDLVEMGWKYGYDAGLAEQPAQHPEGDVVGPCVCGSWPGGKCLKCPRIEQPAQQWPMTDEMVTAAARALNKRQAEACGVDKNDHWKFYGDDIKEDARAVLEAAHGITKGNT